MRVTAIDFETANSDCHSACSIGYCTMDTGELTVQGELLIKPAGRYGSFSYFNTAVNHITADMVADQPEWPAVYSRIAPVFDNAVVLAHNASFDMHVLAAINTWYKIDQPDFLYLDTVQIARFMYPFLANAKLNTVCAYLQMDLQHHQAGSDALGCLEIVNDLMGQYDCYDIEQLMQLTGLIPHRYSQLNRPARSRRRGRQ